MLPETVIHSDVNTVSGFRLKILLLLAGIQIVFRVLLKTLDPVRAWKVFLRTKSELDDFHGTSRITRMVRRENKFYWDMYSPPWPSRDLNELVLDWSSDTISMNNRVRNVVFAVSSLCPLSCEHCLEKYNLNDTECIDRATLFRATEELIGQGTRQIMLSGGEPMMRYQDVLALVRTFSSKASFWIISSGVGWSVKRAGELREAGLTGACISLDHHDPGEHNRFRNSAHAFSSARQAVSHAKRAGLLTALSLCATKKFTNDKDLKAYMDLASEWGVNFIQLLEAKPLGAYEGEDVSLDTNQKRMLEDLFTSTNQDNRLSHLPIISYLDFRAREGSCMSGGKASFYIDPAGDILPCSFCRTPLGNIKTDSLNDLLPVIRSNACPSVTLSVSRLEKAIA